MTNWNKLIACVSCRHRWSVVYSLSCHNVDVVSVVGLFTLSYDVPAAIVLSLLQFMIRWFTANRSMAFPFAQRFQMWRCQLETQIHHPIRRQSIITGHTAYKRSHLLRISDLYRESGGRIAYLQLHRPFVAFQYDRINIFDFANMLPDLLIQIVNTETGPFLVVGREFNFDGNVMRHVKRHRLIVRIFRILNIARVPFNQIVWCHLVERFKICCFHITVECTKDR